MFIRKTTTQKYLPNGKAYTTYRLVRQYRNVLGVSKQETLLNLGGEFEVEENNWRLLCDRIEQLQSNDGLFELELPISLEQEAQRINKLLSMRNGGKPEAKIVSIANTPADKDYQSVDINSIKESDIRYIGVEHLAHSVATQLRLPELLEGVGLNKKQANIALASILCRLIVPGSECRTHRYLTKDSAMDEIIGTEFSNLDLQQLYFASDWLLAHKEAIEQALYLREKELFNLEEVITLFDISNTYFEGHPNHSGVAKGRSKEKRSDCGLISLGLLLDGSGFPKKSQILPGNISEPSTLQEMLATLDSKNDTTIIMDAGIATKDNVAYLQQEGYSYIVVKRDSDLAMPENDSTIVKDSLRNTVTVSLVTKEDKQVELYCHSTAKEAKATEYINKMSQRLEEELQKLANNLPACDLYTDFSEYSKEQSCAVILADGCVFTNQANTLIRILIKADSLPDGSEFTFDVELTQHLQQNNEVLTLCANYNGQSKAKSTLQSKLRKLFAARVQPTKSNATREHEKIAIRIGKLKQQYKSVAHLYEIDLGIDNAKHYARTITWIKDTTKAEQKQAGIYCLSSNRTDLSAVQLWKTYTMLTEIESAFRSLKSELGMRPIYHQKEQRIDGHIFISILAYHVMHAIRYQLKELGINNSWDGLREIMATQIRSTTTLDLENDGIVRIRKTSRATPEQAAIYRALGIDANPCGLVKKFFGRKEERQEVVLP
ncbi:MAG: hypothetical protein EBT42_05440 [Actinobacteria bacterium]|nr:hypothetical protein [Actinomycetota bacterium]